MLIHRMWLGPRPMPAPFRGFGKKWQELNPGAKVIEWGWHNLPEDLANEDVLEDIRGRCTKGGSIEMAVALADVIAYDLVNRFGGTYVNCDIRPLRPLSLLGDVLTRQPWASWESDEEWRGVVNAAFGGPAGHPFWESVVTGLLPARYWRMKAEGNGIIPDATGNALMGEAMAARPGVLHAFPRETFNPVHSTELGLLTPSWVPPPGAVAVHYWDHKRTGRTNYIT